MQLVLFNLFQKFYVNFLLYNAFFQPFHFIMAKVLHHWIQMKLWLLLVYFGYKLGSALYKTNESIGECTKRMLIWYTILNHLL